MLIANDMYSRAAQTAGAGALLYPPNNMSISLDGALKFSQRFATKGFPDTPVPVVGTYNPSAPIRIGPPFAVYGNWAATNLSDSLYNMAEEPSIQLISHTDSTVVITFNFDTRTPSGSYYNTFFIDNLKVVLDNIALPSPAFSDQDHDGIADIADNCLTVPNTNQHDGDNDHYGNACDGDLNQDGFVDYSDIE
ncbi:thrombospondin type 3 repeat-containing protein [Methylomonas koyamae]|uniref:thrombospondin type 3 repeat-containing protein n=1 Tax=Methylomonas koyamae TaxID=702114 RepID=UPI00112BE51D|nr:thrombospondin type 3 repeat-containing protein [Methylomonas koyamae]TPQ24615.1 hypothetical protein C2U68_19010 [Methylomonas koyamae]